MRGLIDFLKRQVIFQGIQIFKAGLPKGLVFNETADQCNPKEFMDVMVSDFPRVVLVVQPDKHFDWKPVGGSVGFTEDGLGICDGDLIAGWILQLMGHSIPIKATYIHSHSEHYGLFSAGTQADGRYFIPSSDSKAGLFIEWVDSF